MSKYFKDHIEWDYGKYFSEIGRISSSVYTTINRFTEYLTKEEKTENEIEIIEDYGSVQMDQKLLESLTNLLTDLKNQSFHNSLVITVFSFLEYSIVEFCRLIDFHLEPNKRFKDVPLIGLDKCKDFLYSNFEFSVSKFSDWNKIKEFQKIRNLIAHNNANLFKDPGINLAEQPDFKEINNNKNIRITESGSFFIKEISYIKDFADVSINFINFTIENVRKKIDAGEIVL